MPEYISHENWNGLKVTVKPLGWRRLFKRLPFFVGDLPEFHLRVEKLSEKAHDLTQIAVWESLPIFQKPQLLAGLRRSKGDVIMEFDLKGSNKISRSGDVDYYLGYVNYFGDGIPIFSNEAKHRDTRLWERNLVIYGAILGAILAFVVGLLSGFIEISPAIKVWLNW